ncbi:MAG: family 78 glycoside hydrolase catalytic domain [Streptomycetaceae bacterium]|nr:family 78 glycoside hydrolase catalytic domain [Streptomycetaceae bacterium]
MNAPDRLRVEHLEAPLGLHVRRPRLSWRLPAGATRQVAYALRTDVWESERVVSDRSVLVGYEGPDIGSGQRVPWQVKVWTDLGESAWSEPSSWETGLLDAGDWTARWIEPDEPDPRPEAGHRPAYHLRREFTLPAGVRRARLYATAHGIYEAFLNGHRVGDLELTPGYTAYRDILHVQTYDVTALLREGPNAIGALLSDGWFRGRTGAMRLADSFGERTAFLAQLHVEGEDASVFVLGTDGTWRTAPGEITAADLMDGESRDLRRARPGWSSPGFDDGSWAKASEGHGELYADFARLTASPAPPVRRVEEIRPASVAVLPSGVQVVDLGQNINGWIRATVPQGDTLTLGHSEARGADGDVDLEHFRGVEFQTGAPLPAGQVDRVVGSDTADGVFEPRHTTHGFQYVRVEGASRPLGVADVTGVVVHSDLRRTGTFRCADERINRLHEIAEWSFRGNACDIPTDCPQRERAGWTGDWMLYVPTAAFLYDVAGFSVKWLRDLAVDQWDDGCLTNFAPDPGGKAVQHLPAELLDQFAGSSGWGDASVIVPWELYRVYGDPDILREFRPMMVRWVEFAAERARTRRHPDRVAARPEPAPHEEFLWDAGFHWGEWCEPDVDPDAFRTADQGAVATAYLHRSAALLSRISTLTGHPDDAERFARLAAADRLVALIREAGTHVGTGFLATPYLLPVLADTGHLDLAFDLLLQDTEPSWLTMIDRGATTIWEEWHGIDTEGKAHASLNHYSKGAVISFLHTHVAGIRPPAEPGPDSAGYRRFTIEPRPGGGLTSAEAQFASPYGTIASAWRLDDGGFVLDVTIPAGTEADIRLPDGRRLTAGPGSHTFR